MAQYVKNDYNYHGARSKTRVDEKSNSQPRPNTQKKNQNHASKNTHRDNSWNSTHNQRNSSNHDDRLWDAVPGISWNQDREVRGMSSRNKKFSSNKGNKEFYVSCQSLPKWDELESEFPSLEVKAPKFNVWEKRKEKMEQIKAIEPNNQTEEERMIQEAIERSKREALKEDERKRQLEEEYKLQMDLLEANPELFEEFRTTDEVVGAYASNYLAQAKSDNYWQNSEDSAWAFDTQSENKQICNDNEQITCVESHGSPDWGLPNEEVHVKSTKMEKQRIKSAQKEASLPIKQNSEISKTTIDTVGKTIKASSDSKKSSTAKGSFRKKQEGSKYDNQNFTAVAQSSIKEDQVVRKIEAVSEPCDDGWGDLDVDATKTNWDENRDGWGNESKASAKHNISKIVDMFGGWGNKPTTNRSYASNSVERDEVTTAIKGISRTDNKVKSHTDLKSFDSVESVIDNGTEKKLEIFDLHQNVDNNSPLSFQDSDWNTDDRIQEENKIERVEGNKQEYDTLEKVGFELSSPASPEVPEPSVKTSWQVNQTEVNNNSHEQLPKSNYSFLLDNIVSDYADLAVQCGKSSKNDTSVVPDVKGQDNFTPSFLDNGLLQGNEKNPTPNCDYNLPSEQTLFEKSHSRNNLPILENQESVNSSCGLMIGKSVENLNSNEKASVLPNSVENQSHVNSGLGNFTFNDFLSGSGNNSLTLDNQDTCPIDPPKPAILGQGSTSVPILPPESLNPAFLTPESMGTAFPMPINPMLPGIMNPNLMMAMNPMMMQQMMMLSNPFFYQQLQHMDMYYKSLGMSLGAGLPLYPQPTPFPNSHLVHNPMNNMFFDGGSVPDKEVDVLIPPPCDKRTTSPVMNTNFKDISPDDDSTDWLKEYLYDDTSAFIPPPMSPSSAKSRDNQQILNPTNQNLNMLALNDASEISAKSQSFKDSADGWGDLKESLIQKPSQKLPGFNEKVDSWGNENMTTQSMRNSRHASGNKSVRQPLSQPNFSNR